MAPFDGVVTKVSFDPGDYASGGQTAFEVSDIARPYFEIDVDEADIGNVRVGMPARVTLQAFAQVPIRRRWKPLRRRRLLRQTS